MRAVELEPVEAALGAPLRGADEVVAHARHVVRVHCAWQLVARTVANRRRRDQRPVARSCVIRQRLVGVLPAQLRRTLRAGVPQLQRDLRRGPGVHVVDDPPPRLAMLGPVHAGAARRDARVGGHAGHLGEHEPRSAVRAAAEMHEVVVVGRAVAARVLRHRRDHDPIREGHAAQRERRQHRRRRATRRRGRRTTPPSARRTPGRAAAGSRARSAGCA